MRLSVPISIAAAALITGAHVALPVASGAHEAGATSPHAPAHPPAIRSSPPAPGPDDEAEAARARLRTLRSSLLEAITTTWRGDQWGVLVVSLDYGDTLFAHRSDRPLTPASNLKLFTTAAALHHLGPSFRYGTYLLTDAPVRDGVLEGDLVLYGTGDPTIGSDRFHENRMAAWEALADSLLADGIREVAGDLVGDATYFQSPSVAEGWQDSYMSADYAAAASALSFNDNVVSLRVTPARQQGWRPEVTYVPGGAGIAVVNVATTGPGPRLDVERLAYDGPIIVEGAIRPGQRAVWRQVTVADPARYAAATLREVLASRGITVRGGVRSVNEPASSILRPDRTHAPALQEDSARVRVLALHRSPPLVEILHVINQRSHNMYAEQVLRTLGREVIGEGTAEGGALVVARFLEEEAGVDPAGLTMMDGSGLSILNRVSPDVVIGLLAHMADSPLGETFANTLPLAGVDRGLRRLGESPAASQLRAKTGTIRNVSALSGYVTTATGERLGFSIISNAVPSTWRAKVIENRIGGELASFQRPPPDRGGQRAGTGAPPARRDTTETAQVAAEEGVEETDSAPGDTAAAAPSATRTHTIRAGDTLDAIARRYGVPLPALERANPGLDPRRLIPGRSIKVPGG